MLNAFEVVGTSLRTNLGTQCTLYSCVVSVCVFVCFLLVLVRPIVSNLSGLLSFHYFNLTQYSNLLDIKLIFFSFFFGIFVTISVNWKFTKEKLHIRFIKVSTTIFVLYILGFRYAKFLIFN